MAFWKKIFKSKYTGREIDAAVAKAGTVPSVTTADEGKALVVDSEGKIVPGEAGTKVVANPTLAGTEAALTGLEVGTTKYKVNQPINVEANPVLTGNEPIMGSIRIGLTSYALPGQAIEAPESFITRINTALAGMATALMGDNKYHTTAINVQTTDTDFEEILNYILKLERSFSETAVTYTDCGGDIGIVPVSENFSSGTTYVNFDNYATTPLGLAHLIVKAYEQGTEGPVVIAFYAQKVEVAT